MKICKNNLDIRLWPLTRCSVCAIRTKTRPCLWVKALGLPETIQCGGISVNVLSDIFKL
jgi:hypothetical protein